MNRSRLIAATGGAVTLLLTAGTALALAIGGEDGGTVGAGQTSTGFTTSPTTSDSTSDSTPPTTSSSTTESTPTHSTEYTAPPAHTVIDSALAIDIALGHVGGGVVTNVEREVEHGRLEWKVRIERNGNRYDVRVDTATGAITRVDAKDDDGGKGRGDDDHDDDYDDRDRGHDDRSGRG
jgi:uncharacterized membrane protein YkoI